MIMLSFISNNDRLNIFQSLLNMFSNRAPSICAFVVASVGRKCTKNSKRKLSYLITCRKKIITWEPLEFRTSVEMTSVQFHRKITTFTRIDVIKRNIIVYL